MKSFLEYDWPGNIRELENTIEKLVVLSPSVWLESSLFDGQLKDSPTIQKVDSKLENKLANKEKEILVEAYSRHRSTRKIARELGINQSTVVRKLKKYNISNQIQR